MKRILFVLAFIVLHTTVHSQPCKFVKEGMIRSDVIKLVGAPIEIDTLGADFNSDSISNHIVIWQYGAISKDGNQRVVFYGDKVSQVIPDGKKYDELQIAIKNGTIPKKEIPLRIEEVMSLCK
jgi:hypothetical protein